MDYMDYKKVDRIADRIKNPTKTPFQKAMSKLKGERRDAMKTPMKKLSDKEKYEKLMANKMKSGGLTGGQKKLDKNKDGKITGEDFKMMKQGYGAARKDGMGLQDESIKPGKVMKASKGGGADTGRIGEMKSKLALAKDKFKKIKGTISSPEMKFIKQAIPGEAARSVGTKIAEAVKKAKAQKMGGGMMQKYQTGGSVMARGCKLGRKKATKLY